MTVLRLASVVKDDDLSDVGAGLEMLLEIDRGGVRLPSGAAAGAVRSRRCGQRRLPSCSFGTRTG